MYSHEWKMEHKTLIWSRWIKKKNYFTLFYQKVYQSDFFDKMLYEIVSFMHDLEINK